PEGSSSAHRPRRPGQRLAGGDEGQADHDLADGAGDLLAVPAGQVRLHRRPGPDLHLQHGAVPRRQDGDPAGLRDQRAVKIGSAGAKIVVHLLADAGYSSYATTIETSWKLVNEKPDVVQRFVNATIEGWYSYLYGDPGPANTLITKENPDMGDDQITYSLGAMTTYGLVHSGDAATLGIGAMSDARWKDSHAPRVEAGLYAPDLDLKRAYTLGFVNKKHGIQLRKT